MSVVDVLWCSPSEFATYRGFQLAPRASTLLIRSSSRFSILESGSLQTLSPHTDRISWQNIRPQGFLVRRAPSPGVKIGV